MHCLNTDCSSQVEYISFPIFISSYLSGLNKDITSFEHFLNPKSELIACYVSLYFPAYLFVFPSPSPFPSDCEDDRAQPTVGTK